MHLPLRVFTAQWGIPQNIARTRRGFHHGAEIPANHYISTRSVSGRYLWERSVIIPWRYINHVSTDRPKVLQISALRAVRSMRAVLCDACWGRGSSCRGFLTAWGPFKATLNAFVAEERTLEDLRAQQVLRASKAASTHIEPRSTGPLVADRGEAPDYPRLQLIHCAAPKGGSCGGKKRQLLARC
jgi:hypothetical protein